MPESQPPRPPPRPPRISSQTRIVKTPAEAAAALAAMPPHGAERRVGTIDRRRQVRRLCDRRRDPDEELDEAMSDGMHELARQGEPMLRDALAIYGELRQTDNEIDRRFRTVAITLCCGFLIGCVVGVVLAAALLGVYALPSLAR